MRSTRKKGATTFPWPACVRIESTVAAVDGSMKHVYLNIICCVGLFGSIRHTYDSSVKCLIAGIDHDVVRAAPMRCTLLSHPADAAISFFTHRSISSHLAGIHSHRSLKHSLSYSFLAFVPALICGWVGVPALISHIPGCERWAILSSPRPHQDCDMGCADDTALCTGNKHGYLRDQGSGHTATPCACLPVIGPLCHCSGPKDARKRRSSVVFCSLNKPKRRGSSDPVSSATN